jgi:uncharacterized membrane protein
MTDLLGHPLFILVLTIAILVWVGFNLLSRQPIDPPPFAGLAGVVSVVSFYMVVSILVTQRREDQLALHREQLILELVISSEQKTAKVISLLEEYRRDDPMVGDRHDQEANEMANPSNPSSVLNTIANVHADAGPNNA